MPHSQHGCRRETVAVAADGDAHGSIRKGKSDMVLPQELMTRRGVPVRAPHNAARERIQCWAVAARKANSAHRLGAPAPELSAVMSAGQGGSSSPMPSSSSGASTIVCRP